MDSAQVVDVMRDLVFFLCARCNSKQKELPYLYWLRCLKTKSDSLGNPGQALPMRPEIGARNWVYPRLMRTEGLLGSVELGQCRGPTALGL